VQAPLHTDGQDVFVGIDWGASHHQLCVVDTAGARRRQIRLGHDVAGLAQLDRWLAKLGERLPVAVERAEGLLVEHLQTRGQVVYPVCPRIAARARERYRAASSKDDVFDAFVLADTLRHEHAHWRPPPVASPALAELRALTRDRDRLLATQQSTQAQLRAILEAYHPAAARLFSSTDRQITLSFIGDYPIRRRPRWWASSAWHTSWPATATPAGSSPRCWQSGCAPTCWPARLAP
jgi:transposase